MPREDFSVPITGALTGWGWNSYFEAFWQCGGWKTAVPARVIAQQRKIWCVAGEFGERSAEASGKLRLAADEGADWPAVGDWVAAELHDPSTTAVIQEVLARRSKFVRKSPGKRIEEQVIAANVDTALLVSALDDDFNPRRVERYLAQFWESGAKPVIVLNKADTCEEACARAAEMERVTVGTAVCDALHLGRPRARFFASVRFVQNDHGLRSGFPALCEVPFHATRIEIVVQCRHQQRRVHIRRNHLLFYSLPRGLA